MKECEICSNEAGKTELNVTGDLCCQRCGCLLCENCAVYGHDFLPRCEKCHFEHTNDCAECKGKGNCELCDFQEYYG